MYLTLWHPRMSRIWRIYHKSYKYIVVTVIYFPSSTRNFKVFTIILLGVNKKIQYVSMPNVFFFLIMIMSENHLLLIFNTASSHLFFCFSTSICLYPLKWCCRAVEIVMRNFNRLERDGEMCTILVLHQQNRYIICSSVKYNIVIGPFFFKILKRLYFVVILAICQQSVSLCDCAVVERVANPIQKGWCVTANNEKNTLGFMVRC